jgi:arsenate reductase
MKPTVLFLCTGNSCRSQMAEGWLRHLAGSRFEVISAGTHPVGVNPRAIAVMAEAGIDISLHRSKRVDEFLGRRLDVVITVCDRAKEACPMSPSIGTVLHWSFDDPAEAQGSEDNRLRTFRRVRDEIAERIIEWLQTEETSSRSPLRTGTR